MKNWEKNIRKVVPYTPGEQPKKSQIIKLNTNENPYPPAPGVKEALEHFHTDDLRLYPDPVVTNLVDGIAQFYQVDPSGGVYVFGSPLFDKATVNVGNGKTFTITAHNNSSENIYIQSVRLNGRDYTKCYLDYKDIMAGGILELEMGNTPNFSWGIN